MTESEPTTERDPGLQPERTGLAWSRTAFLMLLVSALLLRGGFAHHEHWLAWAGVTLLGATGAVYAWSSRRLRFVMTCQAPVNARAIWAMRLTAGAIAFIAILMAISVLYHGTLIAHLRTLLH